MKKYASEKAINKLIDFINTKFNSLKSIAFSGSYNDLNNKPAIPTKASDINALSGKSCTATTNTNNTANNHFAHITLSGPNLCCTAIILALINDKKGGSTFGIIKIKALTDADGNVSSDSGLYIESSSIDFNYNDFWIGYINKDDLHVLDAFFKPNYDYDYMKSAKFTLISENYSDDTILENEDLKWKLVDSYFNYDTNSKLYDTKEAWNSQDSAAASLYKSYSVEAWTKTKRQLSEDNKVYNDLYNTKVNGKYLKINSEELNYTNTTSNASDVFVLNGTGYNDLEYKNLKRGDFIILFFPFSMNSSAINFSDRSYVTLNGEDYALFYKGRPIPAYFFKTDAAYLFIIDNVEVTTNDGKYTKRLVLVGSMDNDNLFPLEYHNKNKGVGIYSDFHCLNTYYIEEIPIENPNITIRNAIEFIFYPKNIIDKMFAASNRTEVYGDMYMTINVNIDKTKIKWGDNTSGSPINNDTIFTFSGLKNNLVSNNAFNYLLDAVNYKLGLSSNGRGPHSLTDSTIDFIPGYDWIYIRQDDINITAVPGKDNPIEYNISPLCLSANWVDNENYSLPDYQLNKSADNAILKLNGISKSGYNTYPVSYISLYTAAEKIPGGFSSTEGYIKIKIHIPEFIISLKNNYGTY